MNADELRDLKQRLGRLKVSQQRILDYEDFKKAENNYIRIPYQRKQELFGDKIHGIDDGEPPNWYYQSHREEFDGPEPKVMEEV